MKHQLDAPKAAGEQPLRPMTALAASARAQWLYRTHRLLQIVSGSRAGLYVYLFCAQPTESRTLAEVRDDPRTRIMSIGPEDPLLQFFPRPQAVLARRFADGSCCHAVLVKDQFAGHIWLARGHYDEDEVRCRYVLPGPTTVWDYDVFIAPPFRATRAMARLWKGVSSALRMEGVMWTYSRISLFNAASVQTHEQLGARQLCTAAFLALGPLQAALFTRPTRLRFALGRSAAPPVLELPPIEAGPPYS